MILDRWLDVLFRRTAPDDERNGKARDIVRVKRDSDAVMARVRKVLREIAEEYEDIEVRRR